MENNIPLKPSYQLISAAASCGLAIEDAINDVWEAGDIAEKKVAGTTIDNRHINWWPIFFEAYSNKCAQRWMAKITHLNESDAKKLWLYNFEPLWLAGCNSMKDTVIERMKNTYKFVLDTYPNKKNDKRWVEQIKGQCTTRALTTEKELSVEIAKWENNLREVIFHNLPR